MDRDIPVFNRTVISKIQKKNQQLHLQRLRNIKNGMSNRTMPYYNSHTISNKKAILQEEEKKTQIQKQNVMLFNKMMKIMKRPDPNNQPKIPLPLKGKNSTNNSRLTEENKGIFQRLQQQKPTISNKKFQVDRMKNLNILKFLGKYPNPIAKRTSYQSNVTQTQKDKRKHNVTSYNHRGYDFEEEMNEEEFKQYQNQISRIRQRNAQTSSGTGRRKYVSQAIQKQTQLQKLGSEESRVSEAQGKKLTFHKPQILLYQSKVKINEKLALVQFFRLYNRYQILAKFSQDINGQNEFELVIPEQQGNQFFSLYNYEYKKIAEMLIIEDGNLVVDIQEESQQKKVKQMDVPEQKKTEKMETMPMKFGEWANYEEALQQLVE